MRPFGGSAEDLTVEFGLALRPELITELLARCCQAAVNADVDRHLLLEMPVGMRIEALVALAALTDPNPFCWRVHCASSGCGQESEFELTVDQIVSMSNELRERQTMQAEIGGVEVVLRRPTGVDQSEWLSQPAALECEAMLRAIFVRPSLDEVLETGVSLDSIALAIDEVMDTFDPLPGLHLSVVCPHCGTSADVSPDLVGPALERLSRAQQAVIGDVHRIASRYHWSERQILELPEWRRQSYLQLIEGTA